MATMIFIFMLAMTASLAPGGLAQDPPATFFVTSPNVFRVGVPERVDVAIIRINNNDVAVPVQVSLMLPGSNVAFLETTNDVRKGSPVPFMVTIEAEHLARNEGSFQHMVLKATSLSPTYPFENETEILVTIQSGYVFVQTDKPIYTPNQSVKIKVMSLDQDMLPSDRTVHVEIINPSGISVKRLSETQAKNGFISGDYKFHQHPTTGNWSVSAFYGPGFAVKSTVTFEVKEYVLPTFSVSIETPKYILAGAASVIIKLDAQYVFGKPVIGRYVVTYGVVHADGSLEELEGQKRGHIDDNGKAEITLRNLDVTFGPNWFDRFKDRHFHVKAVVLESGTPFSEASINRKAVFVSSPYKLSAKRTVEYFKPGLNMQVKLDLTFANGDLAPGIPVKVITTALRADGHREQILGPVIDNNQDTYISNTDEQGGITMRIPNIQSNVQSLQIEASTADNEYPIHNQFNLTFEVGKAIGGEYLVIRPQEVDDRNLIVGESTTFQIQRVGSPIQEDLDLHFFGVTGGKIVTSGYQHNLGDGGTDVTITINANMAPQMRLIVYYVKGGNVVADSLLLGVKEKCRQNPPLSLRILPENVPPARDVYKPNGLIDVEVTASNDSHVGLLAVDKAVYLLRDKDRLTKRKMYERMISYDTGCGPGGGQNSAQIFKDSGTTVLTNAALDVAIREEIGCMPNARRKRRSTADPNCLAPTYLETCITGRPRLQRRLSSGDWTCAEAAIILERVCEITTEQKSTYETCCNSASSSDNEETLHQRSGSAAEENNDVTVREDFRETWFFDIVDMPGDGSPYLYSVSTPSSITEWYLTAVSLSPTQGMCIADDTTVTVFQDFFIQLHLPYSVVRLEQTQIIATIFNYGVNNYEVSVNFTVEEGLCTAENPAIRHVYVEAKRSASVTFIVRPVEVGEFKITVTAGGSRHFRDSVRKTLLVVPQGVLIRKGRSVTLNPGRVMFNHTTNAGVTTMSPNNSLAEGKTFYINDRQLEEMTITLPEDSIPDTESCSVKLIGHLLGTIVTDPIAGLEDLVRQPSGCGEQTMKYLAPTLFVFRYLQRAGLDSADLEGKVYDFIADGVAHELNYRQGNGAYAAFRNRPGSTWLTAFVVKVFGHASQYPNVNVEGHLEGSINWLIDFNQENSGAFSENHRVIHQEMIGAVKGEISMTAFVLVSLLESRNVLGQSSEKINRAIMNATQFLENKVEHHSVIRVYDKAIVTYALALAESAMAREANNDLKEYGHKDDRTGAVNFIPVRANYDEDNLPFWLVHKPRASQVETSAYALLAQLALHDYQYAGRIALWLSNQQNYDGGFVSTQDTVVALQALANYTELPQLNEVDLNCDVFSEKEALKSHHIVNDNAKLQEEVDVSKSIGKKLSINSRGVGVAKANVELRYHTEKSDIDTCPFHLNVSAVEIRSGAQSGQNIEKLRITVCTRYNGTEDTTHMSIIDVGLYSGFKAVEEGIGGIKEMVNASDLISSYDASSRSVIFYLDKIPKEEDLCLTFTANPKVVVGNVQAAAVHVYDYYDPDESCTIYYKPGPGSSLLRTLCSENECICSSGSLAYCNPVPPQICSIAYPREELEELACASHSGYALEINIENEEKKDGFRIYNFTVNNPIKTGHDDVAQHARRRLFINEGCECPKVKSRNIPGVYLLVGQKGLKYTTAQGNEGYRYVYGPNSRLEFWPRQRKPNNELRFDKLEAFRNDMSGDSACANEG